MIGTGIASRMRVSDPVVAEAPIVLSGGDAFDFSGAGASDVTVPGDVVFGTTCSTVAGASEGFTSVTGFPVSDFACSRASATRPSNFFITSAVGEAALDGEGVAIEAVAVGAGAGGGLASERNVSLGSRLANL